MDSALFDRLRSIVVFEIGSLESRLNKLLAEDFPTECAPALIRRLLETIKRQRERIESIVHDFSNDPKGAVDRLRSEHRQLVAIFFPFVVYIDGAQTAECLGA